MLMRPNGTGCDHASCGSADPAEPETRTAGKANRPADLVLGKLTLATDEYIRVRKKRGRDCGPAFQTG
jgi:hypothetical protein